MKRWILLIAISITLFMGWFLWRYLYGRKEYEQLPSYSPQAIVLGKPGYKTFVHRISWIGQVEPLQMVSLKALIDGRIMKIMVRDGEKVEKNQPLFVLGGPQVANGKAKLITQLNALSKQRGLALAAVKRKGQAFEQHLAKLDELEAAKMHLTQIEAQIEVIRDQLALFEANTIIKSPMTGLFVHRQVNLYEDVTAETHLADIMSPGQVRIVTHLYGPEAGFVKEGMLAQVEIGDKVLKGQVIMVAPGKDVGGTTIWIEGPSLKGLVPGSAVRGNMVFAIHKNALAIPDTAIVYDEHEVPYVFIKQGHNFIRRQLKLGLCQGGYHQVLSGLTIKDSIVVKGAYELFYRQFRKTYKVED